MIIPRPIFYLTDFGTKDPYVGIMKAVTCGFHPQIPQHDLTHAIQPQCIQSGMIALQDSWPSIPNNSIICAVVDPGVGSARDPILMECEGRQIIVPDNGLGFFERHFQSGNSVKAWKINIKKLKIIETIALNSSPASRNDLGTYQSFITEQLEEKSGTENLPCDISNTFHGRDIFAPAAACTSLYLEDLIKDHFVTNPVVTNISEPKISDKYIKAEIVSVDHFGNLATNLRMKKLSEDIKNKIPSAIIKTKTRQVIKHGKTFSDVEPGDAVFYESSFNRLEIAVRNGNASEMLGLRLGDNLVIEFS